MRKKMTAIARKRLLELAKHIPKIAHEEIARILNKEGFRTGEGREFDHSAISHAAIKAGIRRQRKSHQARTVTITSIIDATDLLVEVQMVLDLGTPDERKLSLIKKIVC